ncbi:MAG: fatty acid desaturase [Gammaproteobacteria bacterium]|jgi:fatty acid desaturase
MSKNRVLSELEIAQLGAELVAVKEQTMAKVGEDDARYIKAILKAVRYTEMLGRGFLFLSFFPPFWLVGTALLSLSKILENMELGHNVIHGQYDWMNDPELQGKTYEWDIAGTSDNWRKTHNFKHHTYTNIKGMDDDIGFGILRLFPEQPWRPYYLLQPLWAPLFALVFQWGIAVQGLELTKVWDGLKSKEQFKKEWRLVAKKMNGQLLKDYLLFPLISGPMFLAVLAGNLVSNVVRSLWTNLIIFCGHFTADAEVFPESALQDEGQGHWYLRQMRGSSNLRGGKLFHILCGNLSHQIEHHLFPTVPARRYAEMSVAVRAICKKYGQNYNTGSLLNQSSQVLWRIIRHSFPSTA